MNSQSRVAAAVNKCMWLVLLCVGEESKKPTCVRLLYNQCNRVGGRDEKTLEGERYRPSALSITSMVDEFYECYNTNGVRGDLRRWN